MGGITIYSNNFHIFFRQNKQKFCKLKFPAAWFWEWSLQIINFTHNSESEDKYCKKVILGMSSPTAILNEDSGLEENRNSTINNIL